MNGIENNAYFWQKLDTLFFSSKLVISRNKGDVHPKYHNLVYPVSYGYLEDTFNQEQEGIAVYRGSGLASSISTIVIAADILKKDIDVKLLVGCTQAEEEEILRFLNQTDFQKTILVRRGNTVPNWATTE
ncbi:MAG: Inorganic pyrophosphatase [Firmicutes bacterium HGW-Firmicutes-20]|jgi:inorganic pyrophosphatase|nr:MAG: Inorganic pyrophosphatase [Firmicutes bacterium HGW-Firmicutes-20]PKM87070.1 MAG: Inorganic pyrophosphatase [Firmicutes bacterium HGW-Firmicutes-10]